MCCRWQHLELPGGGTGIEAPVQRMSCTREQGRPAWRMAMGGWRTSPRLSGWAGWALVVCKGRETQRLFKVRSDARIQPVYSSSLDLLWLAPHGS